VIDLRPGEGATPLVRENRNLVIGRVKHLVRYGLAGYASRAPTDVPASPAS